MQVAGSCLRVRQACFSCIVGQVFCCSLRHIPTRGPQGPQARIKSCQAGHYAVRGLAGRGGVFRLCCLWCAAHAQAHGCHDAGRPCATCTAPVAAGVDAVRGSGGVIRHVRQRARRVRSHPGPPHRHPANHHQLRHVPRGEQVLGGGVQGVCCVLQSPSARVMLRMSSCPALFCRCTSAALGSSSGHSSLMSTLCTSTSLSLATYVSSPLPPGCMCVQITHRPLCVLQGGTKLERARDIFEQSLDGCPPKYAKVCVLLVLYVCRTPDLMPGMCIHRTSTWRMRVLKKSTGWRGMRWLCTTVLLRM